MLCPATIHETGCIDYNLLKPITDNVSFYVYGKWDSKEAYAGKLPVSLHVFAAILLTAGPSFVPACGIDV